MQLRTSLCERRSSRRPGWLPVVGLALTIAMAGISACGNDADAVFGSGASVGPTGAGGGGAGGAGEGGSTGTGSSVCGDLLCHAGETPDTCIQDCPPVCGDGACNGGETSASCMADCPKCGDDACNGNETPENCPQDCPPVCGDGMCNGGETPETCAADCKPVCGDGACNGGETEQSCAQDCAAPACAHGVCEAGQALMAGCDPCVSMVCQQDPYCCDQNWDGQCVGEADSICNAGCCGDGKCDGEDCNSCPDDCGGPCVCGDGKCFGESCDTCADDCGVCVPDPTCPHSVCFDGSPLDPTLCFDPCVSQVCAMQPSCCEGSPPAWGGECTVLAHMLCGADACVTAVCGQNPTCCTNAWNQACIDLAEASCSTQCDCPHALCERGGALAATCNPCAAAICEMDPYCCNDGWDGACAGEVEKVCGIDCT